jgi:hypothetical protein
LAGFGLCVFEAEDAGVGEAAAGVADDVAAGACGFGVGVLGEDVSGVG